jgi:hypothetical protein
LPRSLKMKYSKGKKHNTNVSFESLAFRMYMILRMNRLLREDAKALKAGTYSSI